MGLKDKLKDLKDRVQEIKSDMDKKSEAKDKAELVKLDEDIRREQLRAEVRLKKQKLRNLKEKGRPKPEPINYRPDFSILDEKPQPKRKGKKKGKKHKAKPHPQVEENPPKTKIMDDEVKIL